MSTNVTEMTAAMHDEEHSAVGVRAPELECVPPSVDAELCALPKEALRATAEVAKAVGVRAPELECVPPSVGAELRALPKEALRAAAEVAKIAKQLRLSK